MKTYLHIPKIRDYQAAATGFFAAMLLMALLLSFTQANAQRVRYEDIIAELDQITNEQGFARLFRYQESNPQFANTYIQIGHLSEAILQELDPLRQIDQLIYWADNAILYYQVYPVYLQGNEVRRTRELYENIPIEASGRRLNNDDVLAYIDERVELVSNYRDSVVMIYETLERSKDHYNLCIRMFFDINEQYDQLKEALLQTDQAFLQRVNRLREAFDACTTEFARYKHLTELFPIHGYDQSYTLQPIETFRLDGLTNSDFLDETFVLWDFGQWVAEFSRLFEDHIVTLRNDIEMIQQTYDNNMIFLRNVTYTDHALPASQYDELFIYRLGVYDSHSLIRELFNYLDEREAFLLMTKDSLNNPAYISSAYLNRKFRYYYRMALQLTQSEERLQLFSEAIDPQRVRRFREFFDLHYNGEPGLHAFASGQRDMLYDAFSQGLNNLALTLQNEKTFMHSWTHATTRGGMHIPLTPDLSTPFVPGSDTPATTRKVFFANDMPAYAGGALFRQQTHRAFVSKITEEQTIEWQQEFTQGKYTSQLFGYENGVVAIVTNPISSGGDATGQHTETERQPLTATEPGAAATETNGQAPAGAATTETNGQAPAMGVTTEAEADVASLPVRHMNTLIHLDEAGKTVLSVPLDEQLHPLYLYYDEINKVYRMVFGSPGQQKNVYDHFLLCIADSTGQVAWKTDIRSRGSFAGLFRAEDRYLFFSNDVGSHDTSGSAHTGAAHTGSAHTGAAHTGAAHTGAAHLEAGEKWRCMLTHIAPGGEVIQTDTYPSARSYTIERIFGISSDAFGLKGYKGTPTLVVEQPVYMIVNARGETVFHNLAQ